MKKLCARGSASLSDVLSLMFSPHRSLYRFLDESSAVSLGCACRETRKAIATWLDAVLQDVSLGKEAIPVPVQLATRSTRSRLERLFRLMNFLYLAAVQFPPTVSNQHKLPVDVRTKQQQSDERCRRAMLGRQVQVAVAPCAGKGWGVLAAQDIQRGEFVGEYTGELVSSREMRRRYRNEYDPRGVNYVLSLREHVARRGVSGVDFDVVRTNVDASTSGSLTRFFNHSCDPNLEVAAVRVDSYVPRLLFFTRRRVESGKELTFDYGAGIMHAGGERDGHAAGHKCRCGANECRGYLPSA